MRSFQSYVMGKQIQTARKWRKYIMLNILKAAPGDEVLRRLYHGDKVFHDALAWVAIIRLNSSRQYAIIEP